MASVKLLSTVTTLAVTISIAALAGCQPAPTGSLTPGQETPAVTPITPVEEPSEEPSGEEPTGEEPVEEPTPIPSAVLTGERAVVSGVIYDDATNRIDGVTVTAKTLNGGTFANGTDTLVVTSQQGAYTLEGCPVGANLQVTVTKSGYTTRQQTIVPKADVSQNSLSFGDSVKDPTLIYAISAKPEVISITPAASATGIAADTTFTLTFNTPVIPGDVESAFAIYAAGTTGQTQTMSLPGVALTNRFDPAKDTGGSSNGIAQVLPESTKFLYDFSAMTSAWSDNNTKVTFSFKPGARLLSDKDATKVPRYAISFKGAIRDANGTNGRSDHWFRLSPVQANRVGATFKVAADTTAPKLVSIAATNKADDAGQNGGDPDVILAKFSEPMALFLGDQDGKPIPRNAAGSGYALLNNMIKYYVSSKNTNLLPDGTAKVPGGFAFDNLNSATTGFFPLVQDGATGIWDTDDTSRSTIRIVPMSDSPNGSGATWAADKAAADSTTSLIKVQNGVTNLFVGDLLQDATLSPNGTSAVYRVNAINAANKELTVTQSGDNAAPAAGNDIRYWSTTTKAAATNLSKSLQLTGLTGLRKGDTLRVGSSQYVTLTADPGANEITFTPGLSAPVASGVPVVYVSPTSTVHTGFGAGYTVWVAINGNVMDPAGNKLDTTGNGNIRSSVAE